MVLGTLAAQEVVTCRHSSCAGMWPPSGSLAPIHAGCLAVTDLACGMPLISGGWNGQLGIHGEAHGSLALPVISACESPSFKTKPGGKSQRQRWLFSKFSMPSPAYAGPCITCAFLDSHSQPQVLDLGKGAVGTYA